MFNITTNVMFYDVNENNHTAKLILKIASHDGDQWLTGYVGVQKGNQFYEADYMDVENQIDCCVHGGLTFSGPIDLIKNQSYWFLGFDCHHYTDNPTTCNKDFVLKELDALEKELIK